MSDIVVLHGVKRCPHCSVSNPFLVKLWSGRTPNSYNIVTSWGAFACSKCGGLIGATSGMNTDFNPARPKDYFPKSRSAHEDVPEVARKFLQQALDVIHAPDAAAVMAGSAVDAMLKELGFVEGSVYHRIDQAREAGTLTKGMADWAHSVRLGANRPRHADANRPHTSAAEAEQSVEFAEALGNFLFVLTAKINRGIAAASATGK